MPGHEVPEPVARRGGRTRDRHGRGPRGSSVLPGPLTPASTPGRGSRRDRFDALVLDSVAGIEERWSAELTALGLLEFAVEETPLLPEDWAEPTVPLAAYLPSEPVADGTTERPARLVLFRRPIELRVETPGELAALIQTVLVEQVAELLGKSPEEIDPRYDDEP